MEKGAGAIKGNHGNLATALALIFLLLCIGLAIDKTPEGKAYSGSLLTGRAVDGLNTSNLSAAFPESDASILRDVQMPDSGSINTLILMKNAAIGAQIRVEELLPYGAEILDWDIVGASGPASNIKYNLSGNTASWEFSADRPSIVLSYEARLPKNAVEFYLEANYYQNGILMGISGQRLSVDQIRASAEKPDNLLQQETPSLLENKEFPMTTILALGSIIIVLAIAILLVAIKRGKHNANPMKDLHLTIYNAMQVTDREELKKRYQEVLKEYNSKNEQEKYEYFGEVSSLYDKVINPR